MKKFVIFDPNSGKYLDRYDQPTKLVVEDARMYSRFRDPKKKVGFFNKLTLKTFNDPNNLTGLPLLEIHELNVVIKTTLVNVKIPTEE